MLSSLNKYLILLITTVIPINRICSQLKWRTVFNSFSFLKASGAYIFRPGGTFPIKSDVKVCLLLKNSRVLNLLKLSKDPSSSTLLSKHFNWNKVPLTILRGSILDEVHQQINPWIYQVLFFVTKISMQEYHFVEPLLFFSPLWLFYYS